MPRTKGARNLSADTVLRKSFMRTFRRAGGEAWLLEQAKAAPLEFLKALIAVTKPPPAAKATEPEPPPAAGVLTDERTAAMHVAFVLAKALHENGGPLVIEGEVVEPIPQPPADWVQPSWMPPLDQDQEHPAQQPEEAEAVEQPALPPPEDKPARRDLADLLGFEPPPATEPHLYGSGSGQYHGDPAEHGGGRRDLKGDTRVVTRRESVAGKYRRMKGG